MKKRTYSRRKIVGGALGLAAAATGGGLMKVLNSTSGDFSDLPNTARMPAVFVGHGTPMSAIQPNEWTRRWTELGTQFPKPAAILSISAHWITERAALVTASEKPPMNYDMYGFPPEMYRITYPAPGHVGLASEVANKLGGQLPVHPDTQWGFDHATWVVLKYMFPKADIPLIQLSIDYSKPPSFHYELGRHLQFLRTKGVLILGSGNFVHNLRMRPGTNNDQPYDWAREFDSSIWAKIQEGNYAAVSDFQKLGSAASLSHPTYDHFLPVLYTLGATMDNDQITAFNDNFQWPAVSMRSFVVAMYTPANLKGA
jgi:4,5-DOPA dioxygenase extradiol